MKKILYVVWILIWNIWMFGNVLWNNIENYTEYTNIDYYYVDSCYWCQELDKYIEENNISNNVKINKIDVAHKSEEFLNVVDQLNLNSLETGLPFITYTKNGDKYYVDWWYYGWKIFFSQFTEVNISKQKTKILFQKQKIISKKFLNWNKNTQKYIKKIDKIVTRSSDKKLISVSEKLENLSYIWKSETVKNIFKYLEAKIVEEKFNRLQVTVKEYWNDLILEQNINNTYLTHAWKVIYTWEHKTDIEPFIGEEACEVISEKFEKNIHKDKQWVWEFLDEVEKKLCLKEIHQKSIIFDREINDRFIRMKMKSDDYYISFIVDLEKNYVLQIFLEDIIQVEESNGNYIILHKPQRSCSSEISIHNNWWIVSLFKWNCDIENSNQDYIALNKFKVLWDDKIKIEYTWVNWKKIQKEIIIKY